LFSTFTSTGPNARAVITIGKDMNFRDYAQGAYRMRGIGKGQTIHLYLIPEVENRIQHELGLAGPTSQPEIDVPAWLLVNSMNQESVQFVQMSLQELHNVWRKNAVNALITEVQSKAKFESPAERMRRFHRIGGAKDEDQVSFRYFLLKLFFTVLLFLCLSSQYSYTHRFPICIIIITTIIITIIITTVRSGWASRSSSSVK
jgi:hypothetical protein